MHQNVDHYSKVASVYDVHLKPYISAVVNCVLGYLPLNPDDIVVDIGAGTGEVAHRVWKHTQLNNHIRCVDPSKDMLEMAKGKEGIEPIVASAEEFFSSKLTDKPPFTKVMMCSCANLFSDPKAVFTSLREHLPAGSGACIVIYLANISPLFEAAKQRFSKGYVALDSHGEIFNTLGLKWRQVDFVEKHRVHKSEWYPALRARVLRLLEAFSDEQIEEGIQELEEKFSGEDELEVVVHLKAAVVHA